MSFFKYPEYWSKEQINLAKKLLDVIRESDLSCADAGTVLDGLSDHMLMRSGWSFRSYANDHQEGRRIVFCQRNAAESSGKNQAGLSLTC